MQEFQPVVNAEISSKSTDVARIEGVDLFCGVGGLSCGLAAEGVRVVAGIDVDPACQYPYVANHQGAKFLLRDVTSVSGEELNSLWSPNVCVSWLDVRRVNLSQAMPIPPR